MNGSGQSISACPAPVDPEKVRAQLERVLESKTFASARSGTRFLRYVVEETLAGRGGQIKEYVVGVAVFERGEAFDPRADAVVRVEATRLRSRLRDYYANEGHGDRITIELPKGSYVPVFQSTSSPVSAAQILRPRNRAVMWGAIGLGILAIVALVWWGRSRSRHPADIASIVVLPFQNLSGDRSEDYLAYSVTEDLIAELARTGKLRVIPHPAVARYQGSAKPHSEIARELKVDAFLEGSVARAGNRVQLAGRIVHAPTGRQLWTQGYERDAGDLPVWPREAARAIAESIGTGTAAGRSQDVLRVNPEAYDAYLRGRFHGLHQTREANEAAISNLERATSLDPNFAAAHAELAQAYVWKLFLFEPKDKRWEEKAYVASERALSLNPESAVAHLSRGRLLWTPANHFPHDKAIREYRRALASDPNLDEARNQLALIYCHIGYFDEALEESRKAVATNPNNNLAAYRIGQTLVFAGHFDQALSVLRQIPDGANPTMIGYQTAWILFNQGKARESAAKIGELLREDPEDTGGLFAGLQSVLSAAQGDPRTALSKIAEAVEKGRGFGHFHHTTYHIATAYARLNRPDDAIHWLETTADDGFPCYPLFARDPNLDSLRKNPRFLAMMEKLKQQWAAFKSVTQASWLAPGARRAHQALTASEAFDPAVRSEAASR